jgi:uncharacterized tellurite resistance protein B-like protein
VPLSEKTDCADKFTLRASQLKTLIVQGSKLAEHTADLRETTENLNAELARLRSESASHEVAFAEIHTKQSRRVRR